MVAEAYCANVGRCIFLGCDGPDMQHETKVCRPFQNEYDMVSRSVMDLHEASLVQSRCSRLVLTVRSVVLRLGRSARWWVKVLTKGFIVARGTEG